MEWVGILVWALALLIALPLALTGWLVSGSFALQSVLVLGGLACCVLCITLDGGRWLAGASVVLALAGALAVTVGVGRLVSDEPRKSTAGQTMEEHAASLAGAQLPLLVTAAFVMALAAAGVTTVA